MKFKTSSFWKVFHRHGCGWFVIGCALKFIRHSKDAAGYGMADMLDFIDKYRDIYEEQFVIRPTETNKGHSLTLTEHDKAAKLRRITVYGVSEDAMLLPLHRYSELDLGNKLKSILKPDLGIFRCCDYLLVSIVRGKPYLFFLEMKSRNITRAMIKEQFKGATCFLEYCHAIIEHFHGVALPKPSSVERRYISFKVGAANKRPTKAHERKRPSTADDFALYKVAVDKSKSATVPFRELTSK